MGLIDKCSHLFATKQKSSFVIETAIAEEEDGRQSTITG